MDKSAIQEIAVLAATSNQAIPDTSVPLLITPSGSALHDLEKFLEFPLSQKGKLETNRIDSLCEYADKNAEDGSTLYIDDASMFARLIIDNGTAASPNWGRNSANLKLQKGSELLALESMSREKLNQIGFVDFMRDMEHCLTFFSDSDMEKKMSFNEAVKSIQKIDVTSAKNMSLEEKDLGRKRSAMEEIEIAGDKKPPALMLMHCVPYIGLDERAFVCRVIAYFRDDDVRLGFRIQASEKNYDDMVKEFTAELKNDARMDGITVYHGKYHAS